jgi:hypothetical protein
METLLDIMKDTEGLDFQALKNLKSESQEKIQQWLKSRRGKFTASEFHRLMGYEDSVEFPKGADTYVLEKVIETITLDDEVDKWSSEAMNWGKLNEKEAIEEFIKVTRSEVLKYGTEQEFVELDEHTGCTPDGLGRTFGVETKCPNSKTHFFYLQITTQDQFKKECKDYYWQIQGSMYITKRRYWYFISYDPRFIDETKRLKILKITRNNDDIKKLKRRLKQAITKKISLLSNYAKV